MDRYLYWLALKQVSGIGAILYKRLIDQFKNPEAVFAASEEALWGVEGISESAAKNILTFNAFDAVKREINQIEKEGVQLLTLTDPAYPKLLLSIYDPPPILYTKGTLVESDCYPVAMVGARNMTPYGRSVAERLSGGLARAGITVVSGLAKGIDAVAHRAALVAGGRTVAVLGSGLDCIYPREHQKLADEIAQQGVLISEFPMGTTPEPHHFPQRNRTISGLSLGVVVVEASEKSGSLITSRHAMEQGREVFAVPGSIFSETSSGVHSLIRSGAKLVDQAEDIIEELYPQLRSATRTAVATATANKSLPLVAMKTKKPEIKVVLQPEEEAIYGLLSMEPKQIDTIIEESHWETAVVSHRLLELELKGVIRQLAGQFYVRVV